MGKFKEQSIKGCDAPRAYLLLEIQGIESDESWDRRIIC